MEDDKSLEQSFINYEECQSMEQGRKPILK